MQWASVFMFIDFTITVLHSLSQHLNTVCFSIKILVQYVVFGQLAQGHLAIHTRGLLTSHCCKSLVDDGCWLLSVLVVDCPGCCCSLLLLTADCIALHGFCYDC
jgi:hypothetical protein